MGARVVDPGLDAHLLRNTVVHFVDCPPGNGPTRVAVALRLVLGRHLVCLVLALITSLLFFLAITFVDAVLALDVRRNTYWTVILIVIHFMIDHKMHDKLIFYAC